MGERAETPRRILEAARRCLLEAGFSHLSTRAVAEEAGVPLSQIHYHFGSKQRLILAVLEEQNRRLLERQALMYGEEAPLWKQWEQACDFLEEDLDSGYVRILQELIAAGWSDPELAGAVRDQLRGWFDLLTEVAEEASARLGGWDALEPAEVAALAALAFLGTEAMILLGFPEGEVPARSALRKVGGLIRRLEEED